MSKTVNTERESPKFIAGFDAVAITVVQDLLTLVAPSDKCLLIHEVNITTEETVAEKLKLELKVGEGNTVGSVGSTPTPVNLIKGYGTVAADVRANDTTQAIAGAGSLTTLLTQYFDIVTGGLYKQIGRAHV